GEGGVEDGVEAIDLTGPASEIRSEDGAARRGLGHGGLRCRSGRAGGGATDIQGAPACRSDTSALPTKHRTAAPARTAPRRVIPGRRAGAGLVTRSRRSAAACIRRARPVPRSENPAGGGPRHRWPNGGGVPLGPKGWAQWFSG